MRGEGLMLEQERLFYEERLQEWLPRHAGRWVLVKDRELFGVFDTIEDALAEGARRFGLRPFLVRRVEQEQPEVRVPALSLGILHADPSHAVRGPGAGS
jgi:hypothetical protein